MFRQFSVTITQFTANTLLSHKDTCSYKHFCLEWPILWPPRILTFPPGTPILTVQAKPLYSQMPLS